LGLGVCDEDRVGFVGVGVGFGDVDVGVGVGDVGAGVGDVGEGVGVGDVGDGVGLELDDEGSGVGDADVGLGLGDGVTVVAATAAGANATVPATIRPGTTICRTQGVRRRMPAPGVGRGNLASEITAFIMTLAPAPPCERTRFKQTKQKNKL
jgi:hypothetical protein